MGWWVGLVEPRKTRKTRKRTGFELVAVFYLGGCGGIAGEVVGGGD